MDSLSGIISRPGGFENMCFAAIVDKIPRDGKEAVQRFVQEGGPMSAMRNLAKVLVLVLVLVMSLSLITIKNTADFSHDAGIDYSEAIDITVVAGIINRGGSNSFNPAGKLTIYTFTKMLLTALGYDSQVENFTDAGWTIPVSTVGIP